MTGRFGESFKAYLSIGSERGLTRDVLLDGPPTLEKGDIVYRSKPNGRRASLVWEVSLCLVTDPEVAPEALDDPAGRLLADHAREGLYMLSLHGQFNMAIGLQFLQNGSMRYVIGTGGSGYGSFQGVETFKHFSGDMDVQKREIGRFIGAYLEPVRRRTFPRPMRSG